MSTPPAPPPPATRTLSVVLREALVKGDEVRMIVAKALADGGGINSAAYLNVEIEGQTVVIPKVAGAGLGGASGGYPVYVLITKDFMLAVGTVVASVSAEVPGNIPIGGIIEWPTATPPSGWLLCDGSSFSAATYPTLASRLGGTTLPDIVRRVPVGAGAGFAVLSSDGQPQANRNISHHHSFSGGTSTAGDHDHPPAGGHAHGFEGGVQAATTLLNTGTRGTATTTFYLVSGSVAATDIEPDHTHGNAGSHSHSFSGNTSGGTPADAPSFIVLNFIIRAT